MQLDEVTRNYDRAARHYDRLTDVVFGAILGIEKLLERTAGCSATSPGRRCWTSDAGRDATSRISSVASGRADGSCSNPIYSGPA
jgi:hypothetical protein